MTLTDDQRVGRIRSPLAKENWGDHAPSQVLTSSWLILPMQCGCSWCLRKIGCQFHQGNSVQDGETGDKTQWDWTDPAEEERMKGSTAPLSSHNNQASFNPGVECACTVASPRSPTARANEGRGWPLSGWASCSDPLTYQLKSMKAPYLAPARCLLD